jgi:hypothetical protein
MWLFSLCRRAVDGGQLASNKWQLHCVLRNTHRDETRCKLPVDGEVEC